MNPSEKATEDTIKNFIRESGGWAVKLHADGVQGRETLDLLGSYKGKPFLVDVKSPRGRVSPMQRFIIHRARRSGYVSGAVSSVEQFEMLFGD